MESAEYHLAVLAREHAKSLQEWTTLFSSHERFIRAVMASKKDDWAGVRAALAGSYGLWLDAQPEYARQEDGASYRTDLERMNEATLLWKLRFSWGVLFRLFAQSGYMRTMDTQLRQIAAEKSPDRVPDLFAASSLSSSVSRHGMSIEDVVEYVSHRLQRASPFGVYGYVTYEIEYSRIPQISKIGEEFRSDPTDIEHWFQVTVERQGNGLVQHRIDAKELRKALELLRTRDGMHKNPVSPIWISAGYEQLPHLGLRVGNVLARVPGIVTGHESWQVQVAYEDFARAVEHVRFPVALSYDSVSRRLVIETRSRHYELDVLSYESVPYTGFAYPEAWNVLGHVNDRVWGIARDLLDILWRVQWLAPSNVPKDLDVGRGKIARFLEASCHIVFRRGRELEQGSLEIQYEDRVWQLGAWLHRAWEGWVPLEYVIWIGHRVLNRDPDAMPWFYLSPEGNLTIVNDSWSYMVEVPLRGESVSRDGVAVPTL